MKKTFLVIGLLSLLSIPTSLSAQSTLKQTAVKHLDTKSNYLMTTGVSHYIAPMIMTAAEMRKEQGSNLGKFELVIYGEAVKVFYKNPKAKDLLKQAKKANVDIILCEFALKKFEISKNDLSKQLKYVDNAFKYSLNAQREGYIALGL